MIWTEMDNTAWLLLILLASDVTHSADSYNSTIPSTCNTSMTDLASIAAEGHKLRNFEPLTSLELNNTKPLYDKSKDKDVCASTIAIIKATMFELRKLPTDSKNLTDDEVTQIKLKYKIKLNEVYEYLEMLKKSGAHAAATAQEITEKIKKYDEKMTKMLDQVEQMSLENQRNLVTLTAHSITDGQVEEAAEHMRQVQTKMVADVIRKAYRTNTSFDTRVNNILCYIEKLPASELGTIELAYKTLTDMIDQDTNTTQYTRGQKCVAKKIHTTMDETKPDDKVIESWAKQIHSNNYTDIIEFEKKYESTLKALAARITKATWDMKSSTRSEAEVTGDILLTLSEQLPSCTSEIIKELYRLMEESKIMPLSIVIRTAYVDHHNYTGALNIVNKVPRSIQLVVKGRPVTITNVRDDLVLTCRPYTNGIEEIFALRRTINQTLGLDPTPKWIFSSVNGGKYFTITSPTKSKIAASNFTKSSQRMIYTFNGTENCTENKAFHWSLVSSFGFDNQILIKSMSSNHEFLNAEDFDKTNKEYKVFTWLEVNELGPNPYWAIDD